MGKNVIFCCYKKLVENLGCIFLLFSWVLFKVK